MWRHGLATMAILIQYGHIGSEILSAAILHDTLEDSDLDPNEILKLNNGEAILNLVKQVSKQPSETKQEFLKRVAESSREARLIKTADRIDNVVNSGTGHHSDPKDLEKLLSETIEFVLPLAESVDIDMANELRELVRMKRKLIGP